MLKLICALLFSIFFFYPNTFSMDSTSTANKFYIAKISIVGNEITEPDIILSELTFKEGDRIDSTTLFFNRERIYSLGIFTSVKLEMNIDTLFISVEESWYIWPIPFLSLTESDGTKFTYGMNVSILNFRGRNEQIDFIFGLGFDPFYLVRYRVPYLFRDEQISLDIQSQFNTVKNRSRTAELVHGKDFEQEFFIGSVSLGKRINLYNRISLTTEYQSVKTPFYDPLLAISNDEIDASFNAGLIYTYDSRDLIQFPSNGFYFMSSIKNYGFGLDDFSYRTSELDIRNYDTLYQNFSYKMKFSWRNVGGDKIPTYANSFFGFEEKIRGYYNKKDEGHTRLFSSFEIKYPIITEWNWELEIPYIPTSLTSYRIAIYAELFIDAGAVKFRHENWNSAIVNTGFGFGFTLLALPYSITRLELGFDKYFNPEIIATFGTSF